MPELILEAALENAPKSRLVDSKIIAGCRFDIGVAGEFFDESDVRATIEKVGAECVPQYMRRQLFLDAGRSFQPPKPRRDIDSRPSADRIGCGRKQSGARIGSTP